MLEIRNITKIYKSKSGSVKALDNVSITFPETGMVFILGKSGSGKSTLLNVIGGLDGYDGGEFIIKGKSSKSFGGSDFDAYRNTFIGFVFQEYNILDDFTVGANIGLALELQGKKATNAKISKILEQVELLGYAKRKPNELSGGQKQRIAIARALVKDPEIIMADEPTGALDSNTGKQILDTLKELSKTKLVIVVSHDRDFAEKYGDRIIEMQDGQILSDVTKHQVEAEPFGEGILRMNDHLLRIEAGYQLTPRDVEMINEYLRNQPAEILVSGDKRLNDGVRATAGITDENTSSVFADTDAETDVPVKDYSGKKTKFIRSRLPMKNALKMGSSGLGHKKFRLCMTILLSLVAFSLFGFADTLGAYDKVVAATDSIQDTGVQNASFSLSVKHKWITPDGKEDGHYYQQTSMNQDDLDYISRETGLSFIPVFNGSEYAYSDISLLPMMQQPDKIAGSAAYKGVFYGFTPAGEKEMTELSFPITGQMPTANDEIAITEFLVRQFNVTGFENKEYGEAVKAGEVTAESLLGKHLSVSFFNQPHTFTISAVIDTGFDYDRYAGFLPTDDTNQSQNGSENFLVDMFMQMELENTLQYGFHSLGYITPDRLNQLAEFSNRFYDPMQSIGTYMQWGLNLNVNLSGQENIIYLGRLGTSADLSALGKINWLDGNPRTKLGKNELLLPASALSLSFMESEQWTLVDDVMTSRYGSNWCRQQENLRENIRTCEIEAFMNQSFSSARADLISAYRTYSGIENPTDDELRHFWRDQLRNDPRILPDSARMPSTAYVDAYRAVYEGILGHKTSDALTVTFYEEALDFLSHCYLPMEQSMRLSPFTFREFLVREYAFQFIAEHPELLTSEKFFEQVILPNGYDKESYDSMEDKTSVAFYAYISYLNRTQDPSFVNEIDEVSYSDFEWAGTQAYLTRTGESLDQLLSKISLRMTDWYNNGAETTLGGYKIVGLFQSSFNDLVISDSLYEEHAEYCRKNEISTEVVAPHEPGLYAFAIAPMPTDADAIRRLVEISFDESADLQFSLQNQVMNTLRGFNEFIEIGAKVFLYVGLGFAVFSALMLMNFISVSISYKRREIGILRAVGARSSDVFKIFFSEAFIIALINYVLSMIVTILATTGFNILVRSEGLNVTLLHFGLRQVILMFLISTLVAALASFFPVWNIARRKPVDAIKNK